MMKIICRYSKKRIAEILNERGFKNKLDQPFRATSFDSVLRQEKHTGTYIWNRAPKANSEGKINSHKSKPQEEIITIEDGCPMIISREQFDRVQEMISEKSSGRSHSKSRNNYMLGGLRIIKCAECGSYMTHDHTKKKKVGKTYIRMPEGCPQSWRDEDVPAKERFGVIWNAIELENKATNARLARSNYIALPHELTLEQGLECVDRFVKENCTEVGMGCTYSVHDLPNNRHVDMMYLISEYDENGRTKSRAKKEYLCRSKTSEEKYMDAQEFKSSEGWEKVFKYERNGERSDMTRSEAEVLGEGWNRINKYPVCRTVRISGWDDLNLGNVWRKAWEDILNDKFKELGLDLWVDCRSYEERGLNKLPTIHESWGAGKNENKKINQQIGDLNKELERMERASYKCIANISKQIRQLSETKQTAKTLKSHEDFYRANVEALETVIKSDLLTAQTNEDLKEKLDIAKCEFERVIGEKWKKHNFKTDPHLSLFELKHSDTEALKAWKLRENERREIYNSCIDELIATGEMTRKEAMAVKFVVIEKEKALKKQKAEERQRWMEQRGAYIKRIEAERKYYYNLKKKSTITLLFELALTIAGVDPVKFHTGVEKVEFVKKQHCIKVYTDPKIQAMIDELAATAGYKTSEERIKERKANAKMKAMNDIVALAEKIKSKNEKNTSDLGVKENVHEER